MKEIPHIGEIIGPEYYHEVVGYDCRIAIRKLMDVYNTLYEAATSITYSNKDEYVADNSETRLIRRSHLRHAIVDLNNCFDLLLQVPWFYFRIGLNNNQTIRRNDNEWVSKIAEKCRYSQLKDILQNSGDATQVDIGNGLQAFYTNFIINNTKLFTIRTLANHLKHNGSLQIKEFEEPLKFHVNINNPSIDMSKIRTELTSEFFSEDAPEIPLGKIKIIAEEFALVDIEYNNSDRFKGEDYSYYEASHTLEAIHNACIEYLENYCDLLELIYDKIYKEIPASPFFDKSKITQNTNIIDLNKWYKK